MFLARLQWYRRWRGGKWGRVTGFLWGTNWIRVADCVTIREGYDEEW